MSPKGAAFLYAAPGRDEALEPLVVSHGWAAAHDVNSKFLDNFNWTGTMDPSAYICVGEAIRFQRENEWPAVRAACHQLAVETRDRINELTGLDAVAPASPCGACREVMSEFAPELEIESVASDGTSCEWTLAELLPARFELPEVTS